jgi:Cof subfamily protein (haloacid dehalogenase superfamily)
LDIRLVAMDLDGTLLDQDKRISEENRQALRACEARGIKMVFASGRSFESLRRMALEVGLSSPIISANGARVDGSPNGPMLKDYPFDPALARTIYGILSESGMYFVVYTDGRLYKCNAASGGGTDRGLNAAKWNEKKEPSLVDVVDDPVRTVREGLDRVYKFVAFSQDTARVDALRDLLSRTTPASISSSWFDNVEVLRPGAGKGTALADLARSLGIKKQQVMAFGDNLNDMDMLKSAGVPVAMENAVEPLKAVARYIAPHHCESGVGRMLKKLVLNGDKP